MGITFGNLMGDDSWAPATPGQGDTLVSAGVDLAGAPAELRAAFPRAMQTSTEPIDAASFNRHAIRMRPNFNIPRHRNNMDELIVVLKGEFAVGHGEPGSSDSVLPGQFFLVRAGTPYEVTAGSDGVTYLAMWPRKMSDLSSTWEGSGEPAAAEDVRKVEFYDFLDEEDWPIMAGRSVLSSNPGYFWHDGSPLTSAPIDMEATFLDAMMITTKVPATDEFRANGWNGLRCRPNFMVPRHHHNMRELIIVFGGEYSIEFDDDNSSSGVSRRVGPGEFFISEPGTPYTMIAGPEGVTYTECWPESAAKLETYWHDRGWIHI